MGGKKNTPTKLQTRKEPLLGEIISSPKSDVGTHQNNRSHCCLRIILALSPLMGCAVILIFLYLLIYQEGGKSPKETSVSQAMADYEPHVQILVLSLTGGTLMTIVTMARQIQIRESFGREGKLTTCLKITNLIASLSNISAYVGFVMLAINKTDSEVGNESQLHAIGSYMFFTLATFWGILQSSILFKQRQYPCCIKIVLLLLVVAELGTIIGYVILAEKAYLLEWISVALIALYIGLFFVLFAVDPVDDELIEFFCCCCRRGRNRVAKRSDGRPVNNGRAAVMLA